MDTAIDATRKPDHATGWLDYRPAPTLIDEGALPQASAPGSVNAIDLASDAHAKLWAHHVEDLAVTRRPAANASQKKASALPYMDAQNALQAAADIVQHDRTDMISSAPPMLQAALRSLFFAVDGKRGAESLGGAARVDALETAMRALRPAIDMLSREDPKWLEEELDQYVDRLRADIRYIEARDRVENSVRIGEKALIEMPDDQHPHEQGALLHRELQKLIPTMAAINEQVIRGTHHEIHHEAQALYAGQHEAEFGPGTLVHLQNVLVLADGWLTLTDNELKKRIGEVHGVLPTVNTYLELVKGVTELSAGALGVTAAYAGAIAKLAGNAELFAATSGLAKMSGLKFAHAIAWLELVHGTLTAFDSSAARQERIDGAVEAGSSAIWLGSKFVGKVAVGTAATSALMLGYTELKLVAALYWEGALGISATLFGPALRTLRLDGDSIARHADEQAKVGLLIAEERDPEKNSALKRVELTIASDLGQAVDELIDDCGKHGFESGVARYPGNWEILREAFAPVMQHKGARTPAAAQAAGKIALERMVWVFAHAGELVVASTKGVHLSDVEAQVAKRHESGEEP